MTNREIPTKVWIGTYAGESTLPKQDHIVVVKSTDEDYVKTLDAMCQLNYQVIEYTTPREIVPQTPRAKPLDLVEFRARLHNIA